MTKGKTNGEKQIVVNGKTLNVLAINPPYRSGYYYSVSHCESNGAIEDGLSILNYYDRRKDQWFYNNIPIVGLRFWWGEDNDQPVRNVQALWRSYISNRTKSANYRPGTSFNS